MSTIDQRVVARNGLGLAGLILGIVGILFGLVPLTFWIAGTLGVIGLSLSFAGRGRVKRGEATNTLAEPLTEGSALTPRRACGPHASRVRVKPLTERFRRA
jgi:hypothetical protein